MIGSKLNIAGNSISLSALLILVIFNLILTLFFSSPFSIHLDFFVALSFLLLCFETNTQQFFTPTQRHILFGVIMIGFIIIATIPLYQTFGQYMGTSEENMLGSKFNNLLYLERVIRMVFSVVLMYVFYQSINLDFGTLLTLVLFSNLLYQFGFKLIIQTVLGTNYLDVIPGSEQLKEQVNNLMLGLSAPNTTNQFNGLPENQGFAVNPNNLSKSNNNLIEDWFYTSLNFIGAIVSTLNIFFFIAIIKLVLNKTLKLRFSLSKIYLPNNLIWFFIPSVILLYTWYAFFGIPSFSSPHYPFSLSRFIVELLINFLIGCGVLYLIQGISVALNFIKHRIVSYKNQSATQTSSINVALMLAFVVSFLGFGFFISPLLIIVFFDILFSCLLLIGISDEWIDYRKRIINNY